MALSDISKIVAEYTVGTKRKKFLQSFFFSYIKTVWNMESDYEIKYPEFFERDLLLINKADFSLIGKTLYFRVMSKKKEYVEVSDNVYILHSDVPPVFVATVKKIIRTNYPFLVVENIRRFPYKVTLEKLKEVLPKDIENLTRKYLVIKNEKVFEPFKEETLKSLEVAVEFNLISEVKRLLDTGVKPTDKVWEDAADHKQYSILSLFLDRNLVPPQQGVALLWLIAGDNKDKTLVLLLRKYNIQEEHIVWLHDYNEHFIDFLMDNKIKRTTQENMDISKKIAKNGNLRLLKRFLSTVDLSTKEQRSYLSDATDSALKHKNLEVLDYLLSRKIYGEQEMFYSNIHDITDPKLLDVALKYIPLWHIYTNKMPLIDYVRKEYPDAVNEAEKHWG